MELPVTFWTLVILGYFLGSIPFGKIIGNMRGVDIQRKGSGNIGFANAVRVLGWKPALLVLVGDTLKGFLPTLLAVLYLESTQALLVALISILGHIFPVWLKGKGGKGIATGLGVTLAINPLFGLIGLVVYGATFWFMKKSAPSSLVAAWALPIACLLMMNSSYALFYLCLAVLVTWTHRTNIRQLKVQFVRAE